jgi:adenine phosphoribosyltransferase
MTFQSLDGYVRKVPAFPIAGILFHDIAPLLRDHLAEAIGALDSLLSKQEWMRIDAIVGIESRGFILGAALAEREHKGFVPVRKAGKLPPPVIGCAYKLEYGASTLEIQSGSGRVVIIDDILATGGTLGAAATLASDAGYNVAHVVVLIDLGLVGNFLWRGLAACLT